MNPDDLCFGCLEPRGEGAFCRLCGYRHDAPPKSLYLKPGTVLREQYMLGRVLGHGGFGITYLAWDTVLKRKVAIKEYMPNSLATRDVNRIDVTVLQEKLKSNFDFGLQRFLDEAQVVARFHGFPNIISVLTFFPANQTAYMVMEYLEGETLQAFLDDRGGRISYAEARAVVLPVMDALREVHRHGVLHRDISPDNVFLVKSGPVKLLDFGAARYAMTQKTRGISIILKDGYAPEEQYAARGDQGPWTDVYALGGTLYRAITGKVPPVSIGRRLTDELAPPSHLGCDIPPAAEHALLRSLAVQAADRFQSVDEFQQALLAAADAPPSPPRPPGDTQHIVIPQTQHVIQPQVGPFVPPTPKRPSGAAGWLIGGGVLAAIGILGAVLVGGLLQRKPALVKAFTAEKTVLEAGESTRIVWDVADATKVSIEPGLGSVAVSGQTSVTPGETTEYRLTAVGKDGKPAVSSLSITVRPRPASAVIESFSATPPEGTGRVRTTRLSWSVRDAALVEITPAIGRVPPSGSVNVRMDSPVTFVLSATGQDGEVKRSTLPVSFTPEREKVPQPLAPQITLFEARPGTIMAGQQAVLRWTVKNAVQVFLQPGVGAVALDSGVRVNPSATTTYVLTARSANGAAVSSQVVVKVEQPTRGVPPQITFTATPTSVRAGQPVTLSWQIRNAAGASIQPGVGNLSQAIGQTVVTPQTSTRYQLTARSIDGLMASAVVDVIVQPNTNANPAARQFQVFHEHGNNQGCSGILGVTGGYAVYRVLNTNDGRRDDFNQPVSAVEEARANIRRVAGRPSFHIRLQGRTLNFAPLNASVADVLSVFSGR